MDLLQAILPNDRRRDELKQLLQAARFDFEVRRLEKFAKLLDLPNAVGAYEYLQNGERHGIKQWKQFVHIPDLTNEKQARRAAKTKAKADMKKLVKDGLLILDLAGDKTAHPLFPSFPVWCIDASSNEVLLAWTGSPIGHAGVANVSRVDVRTGKMIDAGVRVSSHLHSMAASPNGAWLAVGCACGDWKTQICDLKTGKLAWEIPQSRAVSEVCFSQSNQALYSLSESTISEINPDTGTVNHKISLQDGSDKMVLHPAGEHMVAVCQGLVTIVHLPSKVVLKSVWIRQQPGPMMDLMEQIKTRQLDEKFMEVIQGGASSEERERIRRQMERHFLPKQGVFSVSFGALGNYLFCGTYEGVNVIPWEKILAASDGDAVEVQTFIPAEQMEQEEAVSIGNLIRAVPVDSVKRRLLFAGMEGMVKFVNFQDGRIDRLLTPPIKRPFWRLSLTPDRISLVGTATPKREARGKNGEPSCFQIWNYKALCEAANLDW